MIKAEERGWPELHKLWRREGGVVVRTQGLCLPFSLVLVALTVSSAPGTAGKLALAADDQGN